VEDRTFTQELSASDSLMWRIESDPVLRSPILVVGLLDRSPSAEGLEVTLERAARALPRMRQRVVEAPLDLRRPHWEDAGEPSLAHHVRRVRAPGADLDSALEVAAPDATAAFDPVRPPWTLTIIDGLDEGRAAFVLRFHHSVTDGVGGISMADRLFDHTRRPARNRVPTTPPPPDAPTVPPPTGGRGPLARAAGGLGLALALARHPGDAVATSVRFGRSVARVLAPPPASSSPALAGRSLDRRLFTTERPLAEVQRAARAAGGTVNDVLLAAVGGALTAYHRAQGSPVSAVRVTMPISIRVPGDEPGGNRFVPARFTLPIDDPDPRARVRIAGAIARGWRHEPALRVTNLLASGLDLLPRPAVTRVFGDLLRTVDIGVVDVPGIRGPAFLGGGRIDRMWAFAPLVGAALSVTLLSHGTTACISLMCDTLPVTDPELMLSCLEDGMDEMIALGRTPATRARAHGSRRSA
jgi:WS/DGAT/MGAT family acyltransferase